MNEKLAKWKDSIVSFWTNKSKSQKGIMIGSTLFILLIIIGTTLLTTKNNFVTLYNNLSLQEANQIKTELDARAVPYELQNAGTTIAVPQEQVDSLLVDLAGQGIPNSGNIDYSFFSENSSWGVTDNEFNVMKLDAMQTELANLMQGIEGINGAEVMINLPEEPVFASQSTQTASASIVLNTAPGYQFQGNQINSLYHLVSKAVPNLPEDNIVIMNQYFEYFDRENNTQYGVQDAHSYQQTVKRDVERDIQRRLQQMLGAMVGMDNVIVSVTTDIDFTQENRTEELIEPVEVDGEEQEGLPVSAETIQESYTGNPEEAGGPAGTGGEEVPGYTGVEDDTNGDYELDKETVNYEFNRIKREIVESPYKIRDLGIQVAINSGEGVEEAAVREGVEQILGSIVETTVNDSTGDFDYTEKISVAFQEFNDSNQTQTTQTTTIPLWMYIVGASLIAIILVLITVLIMKRRQSEEVVEEQTIPSDPTEEIPDIQHKEESESVIHRKQLEKVAKEKPEEFAKLLRSWISEE